MTDERLHVVVVSGLSGSGKTTAVKALEDAGYFCIDNLPPILLDKFLVLCRDHPEIPRVGVVFDIRSRAFLSRFEEAWARACAEGFEPELVFLTADEQALVRRYSESRRLHPMAGEGETLQDAVRREREVLTPLLDRARHVIDTTGLNVHQLKQRIRELAETKGTGRMQLRFLSFGFKHGLPVEADYVFDLRALPNPYFVAELRGHTGQEAPVIEYLEAQPPVQAYLKRLLSLLKLAVPGHQREGKMRLTVAVGCTGGRHRSVWFADELARAFHRRKGLVVSVEHRDLERGG